MAPESVPWFADVAGCGGTGGEAWILGRGRQFAPGTGHREKEILTASGLRQAAASSV